MRRTTPIKFPLPGPARHIRVERFKQRNNECGSWALWLMANGDFTNGTFIKLEDNGSISRVTWHPDGSETVFQITED